MTLSFGANTISNQSWTVGTAVSLILPTATGGTGTIVYSLSPTTPAGVTFTAGTRVLAGTPTAVFPSATFTYTATDTDNNEVELTFTIVVAAAMMPTTAVDEIHIVDNTGNEVGVVATDTADGQDAVALRIYDLPPEITTPHAAVLDGDGNLHIGDTSGDEVAVIATDTARWSRSCS